MKYVDADSIRKLAELLKEKAADRLAKAKAKELTTGPLFGNLAKPMLICGLLSIYSS